MSLGEKTLSWVVAFTAAAVALIFALLIPGVALSLAVGRDEMRNPSSIPGAMVLAMSFASALSAWTWMGLSITPDRHRRIALIVFVGPVLVSGFLDSPAHILQDIQAFQGRYSRVK